MSDLTILTVVENDKGLLELMVQSVLKFTKPHPKFLICDNGNNKTRIDQIRANTGANIVRVKHKPDLSGGSNRHGSGLNRIFCEVDTEFTAIVESDVVVLCDSWYKIGPIYRARAALKENYEHIYHVCLMVFETNIMKNMDFMPGRLEKSRYSNKNYKPADDVGWDIGNHIRQDYIQSLTFIDCKTDRALQFKHMQSDEFHDEHGGLVAAHFGRGSNIGGKAVREGFKHPKDQLVEWKKKAEEILR